MTDMISLKWEGTLIFGHIDFWVSTITLHNCTYLSICKFMSSFKRGLKCFVLLETCSLSWLIANTYTIDPCTGKSTRNASVCCVGSWKFACFSSARRFLFEMKYRLTVGVRHVVKCSAKALGTIEAHLRLNVEQGWTRYLHPTTSHDLNLGWFLRCLPVHLCFVFAQGLETVEVLYAAPGNCLGKLWDWSLDGFLVMAAPYAWKAKMS